MNKKIILLAIGGSLLLGTPALRADDTNSTAQWGHHRGMWGGEHSLVPPGLATKLNLSADQKAKIQPIEDAFDKTRQDYMAAHKADIDAARAAMKQAHESKDATQMTAAHDQMTKAMAGLETQRKDAVTQIKSLLTDAQKQTWDAAVQDMHERRGGKKPNS